MAAANFSRDVLENPVKSMDAANFSRHIIEISTVYKNDLIDLESVIENPVVDEDEKISFLNAKKCIKKQKLYNHCDWLKIGKNERCGKRCEQFYCRTHSKYINKGGVIPLPCLCCGVGVRRHNQLCGLCEQKYGVQYN